MDMAKSIQIANYEPTTLKKTQNKWAISKITNRSNGPITPKSSVDKEIIGYVDTKEEAKRAMQKIGREWFRENSDKKKLDPFLMTHEDLLKISNHAVHFDTEECVRMTIITKTVGQPGWLIPAYELLKYGAYEIKEIKRIVEPQSTQETCHANNSSENRSFCEFPPVPHVSPTVLCLPRANGLRKVPSAQINLPNSPNNRTSDLFLEELKKRQSEITTSSYLPLETPPSSQAEFNQTKNKNCDRILQEQPKKDGDDDDDHTDDDGDEDDGNNIENPSTPISLEEYCILKSQPKSHSESNEPESDRASDPRKNRVSSRVGIPLNLSPSFMTRKAIRSNESKRIPGVGGMYEASGQATSLHPTKNNEPFFLASGTTSEPLFEKATPGICGGVAAISRMYNNHPST
jgi:hypothetical protein